MNLPKSGLHGAYPIQSTVTVRGQRLTVVDHDHFTDGEPTLTCIVADPRERPIVVRASDLVATEHGRGPRDWFTTSAGVHFYPVAPLPTEVHLRDIAHHLSNLCRFNGATREFYSVAQHSVLVARQLPPELQRWGLLHDASEAYVGDMVRPLKYQLPEYRLVELRVMHAIAERFGLTWPEPPEVKLADNLVLNVERCDLLDHGADWPGWDRRPGEVPTIQPWAPREAKARFLREAARLGLTEAA